MDKDNPRPDILEGRLVGFIGALGRNTKSSGYVLSMSTQNTILSQFHLLSSILYTTQYKGNIWTENTSL